ncbi:hypothetical protein GJ496_001182 [Pomphorhynchus laevis]|nr:hypothetical protein GJ496_001182 [Pomphorhynchus laevis]
MFEVYLNVYDIMADSKPILSRSISTLLRNTGIYHTAVMIDGWEFYYGQRVVCRFGYMQLPLKYSGFMGNCYLNNQQINEILNRLSAKYNHLSYNLISHNCNNFTDELLFYLVGGKLPSWVNRSDRYARSLCNTMNKINYMFS